MKKTPVIFLLLIITFSGYRAQRMLKLTLLFNGNEKAVSYYSRKGLLYVSLAELTDAIGVKHYYNKSADKTEVKTNNLRLKFTARNQFVIISDSNGRVLNIYQMPISTILINNDVFIPIVYAKGILEKYLKLKFSVNKWERIIKIRKSRNAEVEYAANKTPGKNSSYDVTGISISEKSNGTLIKLITGRPLFGYSASVFGGRLIVSLGQADVPPDLLKNMKPVGLIKKGELKKVNNSVQLDFLLGKNYESVDSFTDEEGNILIAVHNKIFKSKNDRLNKLLKKWKFDTIIIDPGHGGKDAGAIGLGGVKEKNINLKIALKLGKIIKRNLKNIKVVFTRKTDKFVELYKRGKIANEKHGDLFISIHCNSLRHKPDATNGFEIYLLRPGRTKEAIRIAEYENSVIRYEDDPAKYKKLTAENFILVSMARSAFMRYSEKFSDFLNQTYSRYTAIKSRGVKQAGFYVLVGASMPGVLIETGFLSNRKDVRYLSGSKGQYAIAKAIFLAIKKYIKYYSNSVKKES